MIELMGSGFLETFKSYKERGLDTPEVIEGEGYIKCILPRTSIKQRAKKGTKVITNEQQDILNLFRQATELSISDIMHALHIARTTAARRIAQMLKQGLLVRTGQGKGARYCTKS
jgi:predicted HTH transcriptional regulator